MSSNDKLPIESNDDAILRMLSGAQFSGNANITLPSGYTMNADEASAFTAAYSDGEFDKVIADKNPAEPTTYKTQPPSTHPNQELPPEPEAVQRQLPEQAMMSVGRNVAAMDARHRERKWRRAHPWLAKLRDLFRR